MPPPDDRDSNSAKALPKRGACHNCGFLSRHNTLKPEVSEYFELTRQNREDGRFFGSPADWPKRPVCFRGVPLLAEILKKAGLIEVPLPEAGKMGPEFDVANSAALAVTEMDRRCKLWYEHQPGISPAERFQHQEADAVNAKMFWLAVLGLGGTLLSLLVAGLAIVVPIWTDEGPPHLQNVVIVTVTPTSLPPSPSVSATPSAPHLTP
jgi:hypothetical protein